MKPRLSQLLSLGVLILAVSAASQWWSGRHQAGLGEQLAALAQPGDIRMISSDYCGFCVAARRWMTENGVPFTECFIERDSACRQDFEALGAPGTPVLQVRGQAQLGFSPERVTRGLQGGR